MATKEEKDKALAAALKQIEKQFGKGALMLSCKNKTIQIKLISVPHPCAFAPSARQLLTAKFDFVAKRKT